MEKNLGMSDLTLREVARSLFRHKTVIFLTFVVITTGAFIGLKMQTPIYEASVKMYIKGVSQTEALTYQGIGASRIHITQMEIVRSEPVLKRAVTTLKLNERPLDYEKNYSSGIKKIFISFLAKKELKKLDNLDSEKRKAKLEYIAIQNLKKNISTELIPDTDIFYITAKDYDPDVAVSIANVVSRAYTIFDQQQQLSELALKYGNLHPTVQQLQDNIFKMDQNLSGDRLPDLEAIGASSVKIVEQAITNGLPIGKSKIMLMLVAIFASGILGISLALFFDMIDQTFKSPEDIVTHADLAVLGSIPKRRFREKPFVKDTNEPTRYTVFYEDLADQIYIFKKTQNIKTILVASPTQRDLNFTITSNLGYIFSNLLHHKTLMVDCNLKNPIYQTLLGVKSTIGLANLIDNSAQNDSSIIQKIDTDLDVISAGSSTMNLLSLMDRLNLNETLKPIKDNYEIIFLDCTNIKNFNDIILLSSHVDSIILIINEGIDRKQVVKSVISPLKINNINILGGILNNRTFKIPEVIYKRI